MPSLVLGIDTGGTFTDGVLLDYDSRTVLAAHKSLTTRYDFAAGIENVIAGIRIADPAAIKMVSISTTLATNAIAEGKGKRVALFLIGYDPELIANFRLAGRFATPHFFYFQGGHDLYGREQAPLDLAGILGKIGEIRDQVDALAISGYFSPLNPEHENRAYQAVAGACDLPIVLGHQLSTKLGSVERATTAALNASLLAVLQDFVVAVRRAMARRRIDAPLMVVRGDGTLMSDEFAARTPVETIHSGPAASAIGGRFLTGLDDALVIDIGGTTTDLALLQAGQVTVNEEGASVGSYKTAVKAANLLSIGLGGDSHITLNRERELAIGPERVTPLAYLATQSAEVKNRLKGLSRAGWVQATPEALEFWFLLREPPPSPPASPRSFLTPHEQALVSLLRSGPQPLTEILKRLKVLHVSQLDARNLLRQEIIGKAGLTPTDLLHSDGRFAPWDADAAAAALQAFARLVGRDQAELRAQAWVRMTGIIAQAIVSFLTGRQLPPPSLPKDADLGRWFFSNSLRGRHPILETSFRLRCPIIGIGAPAGILLPDVAAVFHTDLVLPRHFEVANAVGAIAGSVVVNEEILVYPRLSQEGLEVLGYFAQTDGERQVFAGADDALSYARRLAQERALAAAQRSGADNPQVAVEEVSDGLDSYRVRARAVGNPRLSR
ncbi:MAG: hydantoinase/oxoprolinase family protein [Caldilineales bacterium]|nr:hydantoinase/oxoprolinase family protein [Caldilineales bacterium]